jgi:Zn-dependent protease with chaperone function
MSGEWYLMSGGAVKGPLSARQLWSMAQAGKLQASDRVRRDDGQWVEASRVKGLFETGPEASAVEEVMPVARSERPGTSTRGDSTRGLPGVNSIRQCISREERKKWLGAAAVSSLIWLGLALVTFASFGVVLVFWFIGWLINRILSEYHVRKLQAVGTAATADQFPEVAKALSEICTQFEVKRPPKVIVLNSSEVNAFALRFARKRVIVLLSEVLDGVIDHPGQLRFILAHELGHLVLDDSFGGKFLLYRPAAFKAARELTCDNCGCSAAGDLEDAKIALKRVGVGNRLYPRLNDPYLEVEAKYIYSGITGWLLKQYLPYPPLGRRLSNIASFHQAHA